VLDPVRQRRLEQRDQNEQQFDRDSHNRQNE